MEWFFYATKPSFMSVLTGWERTQILVLSPLPLIAVSAAGCAALWLAGHLAPRARGAWVRIGMLWPGLVLASSFLLLLDNFTYTLFRMGVQTATGFWRYGYGAVFGLFWFWGWRLGMGTLRGLLAWGQAGRLAGGLAGIGAACLAIGLATGTGGEEARIEGGNDRGTNSLPNILLLTPDGISAEHMSAYGYERDTTPFIRLFIEGKALFCENGFANANTSGGSLASLLTGKLPTTTRLIYPPEILMGKHAYEHLPGILRNSGYENVDIGARQFADAYDLNLLNAFDEANGRKESRNAGQGQIGQWLGMATGYFLGQTWERLRDRVLHFTGMKNYESAYEVVAGENLDKAGVKDDERMARLLRLIQDEPTRPFFVHVHFLVTHGPNFRIRNPVFSKGQKQTQPFERDFYDDAILEFDGMFEKIVQTLQSSGRLDNTILVLASDHEKQWGLGRIPLVFWFPEGKHAGNIRSNTQNIDIAPTLLQYLNIQKPDWMEGLSLLNGEPPVERPVFGAVVNTKVVDAKDGLVDRAKSQPPFYSLGLLRATIAHRAFTLDLTSEFVGKRVVAGHTQPLSKAEELSHSVAREILLQHLEESGYDIPSSWQKTAGET